MFRYTKCMLAMTVATVAIATGPTASAYVPHEPASGGDTISAFTKRPCSHALRIDRRTGQPVGPITTYGARCAAV